MKDINPFRWSIWPFFESLTQYLLSILSGYPNYTVNYPVKRILDFVNQRLRQDHAFLKVEKGL